MAAKSSRWKAAIRRSCFLTWVVCLLGGCAGLPERVERSQSHAMLDTAETRLGRAIAPGLAAHPGLSGFHPVGDGADAFVARLAIARAAERTLDVQYYIFHADDTGVTLLGELLAAADRGVRVRLLLDDIHTSGQDAVLAAIDSHPNVEVRLFNPFAHRGARWIELVTDFGRVNRRMHNKSMTADSQASIVGGRNVGDPYFAAGSDLEFGDFDVLAVGPVVAEVSAQFDEYWNSFTVYPMASLLGGRSAAEAGMRELRDRIAHHAQALRGSRYALDLAESDLPKAIAEGQVLAYWGKGTVIADSADKVRLPADERSTHAMPRLGKILAEAKQELILVSPYFVPGKWGVRWLQDVAASGVRIKILTNSFAATDVGAVHAGYTPYREALLRSGIELYELKPSAGMRFAREGTRHLTGSSRSSLHAKTYMADGRSIFVGSLNLDPRSAFLNTEMGVVIESAALCVFLRDRLLRRLPDIAWRVELDRGADSGGQLAWIGREDGREVRYDAEPGMGALQKAIQGLLRLLPIEEQL